MVVCSTVIWHPAAGVLQSSGRMQKCYAILVIPILILIPTPTLTLALVLTLVITLTLLLDQC